MVQRPMSNQGAQEERQVGAMGRRQVLGAVLTWDLAEKCLLASLLCLLGSGLLSGICTCCTFLTCFLLLDFAALTALILLAQLKVDPSGRAVIISGCDTGFGYALAKTLYDIGFTVFAGCLLADKDGEGAKKLKAYHSPRMHVIQLDVTSDESVAKAVEKVRATLPQGLWAVVNNAGWSSFGEGEWVPMHVYKNILEVNLLGTIRMTKAFLPLIRPAKGRVVNVASILGRMCSPQRAPYCTSKWGVEGFSDCLRFDLRRWGVEVVVIEPGNFVAGTELYGKGLVEKQGAEMWKHMSEEVRNAFGKSYFDNQVEKMSSYTLTGNSDITPVVCAMVDAVSHTFPQRRYQPMSLQEKLRAFAYTHLPERMFEMFFL